MDGEKGQDPEGVPGKLRGAEEKQGRYDKETPAAHLDRVAIILSEEPTAPGKEDAEGQNPREKLRVPSLKGQSLACKLDDPQHQHEQGIVHLPVSPVCRKSRIGIETREEEWQEHGDGDDTKKQNRR